ncbi:MAG: Methyltransferase type 11 [Frankiales bacterium]|nr:Methyltransferase type 11 [Frankiales bacterium]
MSPLELYGEALRAGAARVRYADGVARPRDVQRYVAADAPGDAELLARCGSATLDVGCGPGRLARALLAAGVVCTGVDVAPVAVDLARARGAQVLHASVHDPVLDGTRWSTVLLADGNIGIGGDPVNLLRRAAALLAPEGHVVVELDPPSSPSRRVQVRLETSGRASSWFPWAHVAADDVDAVALPAGLRALEAWEASGRHFVALGRALAVQDVA